jgi:hypothetical protein
MRGTISRPAATIASVVFACLLSVTSVTCAGNSVDTSCKRCGPRPPELFEWDYTASVAASTPQKAYAVSARFMPCDMRDHALTAPDQSVTWLISGPNAGFAYLRATFARPSGVVS